MSARPLALMKSGPTVGTLRNPVRLTDVVVYPEFLKKQKNALRDGDGNEPWFFGDVSKVRSPRERIIRSKNGTWRIGIEFLDNGSTVACLKKQKKKV